MPAPIARVDEYGNPTGAINTSGSTSTSTSALTSSSPTGGAIDWSKWGSLNGPMGTYGMYDQFMPEETLGSGWGSTAYDYNPDKTYRRLGTYAPTYVSKDVWSVEAPEEVAGYRGTDTIQRLVNGEWQDVAIPHREAGSYLWSGANDPRLFGADADKSSALSKWLFDNPEVLGQVNERSYYGYDANMYSEPNLPGYFSGQYAQTVPTDKYGLNNMLNTDAGAAWTDYMSPGAQSERSDARQMADVMDAIKAASTFASIVGAGNFIAGSGFFGPNLSPMPGGTDFLAQTGELGIDPSLLESGFVNPAVSSDLVTPSWLNDLLGQTGELGVDPASIESGYVPQGAVNPYNYSPEWSGPPDTGTSTSTPSHTWGSDTGTPTTSGTPTAPTTGGSNSALTNTLIGAGAQLLGGLLSGGGGGGGAINFPALTTSGGDTYTGAEYNRPSFDVAGKMNVQPEKVAAIPTADKMYGRGKWWDRYKHTTGPQTTGYVQSRYGSPV